MNDRQLLEIVVGGDWKISLRKSNILIVYLCYIYMYVYINIIYKYVNLYCPRHHDHDRESSASDSYDQRSNIHEKSEIVFSI